MALTLGLYSPIELMQKIADKAKALRLQQDLSRESLAARSGVAASTIKKFEMTGQVSLQSLVLLAVALGAQESLLSMFKPDEPPTLDQMFRQDRQRGRG